MVAIGERVEAAARGEREWSEEEGRVEEELLPLMGSMSPYLHSLHPRVLSLSTYAKSPSVF